MGRKLRSEIFNKDEIGFYHLTNRCVLQAFLCGLDKNTGISYEHRKNWFESILARFSRCFLIDIGAYNIMCNHFHLVVKTRPDLTDQLDDEEVMFRWWNIIRADSLDNKMQPCPIGKKLEWTIKKGYLEILRERLTSISWFMGRISQLISRAANKESGTSGRFWQGRFHCQQLLGEDAVLAGMAYTDLNKVRANLASSAEESEFCSLKERVSSTYADQTKKIILAPIDRGNRETFLNLDLEEYRSFVIERQILDETKKCNISEIFKKAAHSIGNKVKLEVQKQYLNLKRINHEDLIGNILENLSMPILV